MSCSYKHVNTKKSGIQPPRREPGRLDHRIHAKSGRTDRTDWRDRLLDGACAIPAIRPISGIVGYPAGCPPYTYGTVLVLHVGFMSDNR
jgi:hypothetical protein